MAAAQKGDAVSLKRLLTHGVDADTKNSEQQTALYFAVTSGNLEAVEALLNAGAAIEGEDNHAIPALSLAAEKGFLPIIIRLLDEEANITHRDKQGNTPLFLVPLQTVNWVWLSYYYKMVQIEMIRITKDKLYSILLLRISIPLSLTI